MKSFLQPVRLGVFVLLVFAGAAAAPAAATADLIPNPIQGTATGQTIPLGNGTFRIVGTFTDPSTPGIAGTYVGTYVETTTGYTSCPFGTLAGLFLCGSNPALAVCNLIQGSVTIRVRGDSTTFSITSDWVSQGRLLSAVCLNPSNPEIHNVSIFLIGPGSLSPAFGSLRGTSTPLTGGVYEDAFSLSAFPGIDLPA